MENRKRLELKNKTKLALWKQTSAYPTQGKEWNPTYTTWEMIMGNHDKDWKFEEPKPSFAELYANMNEMIKFLGKHNLPT